MIVSGLMMMGDCTGRSQDADGLARLWAFATELWGSDASAQRFLAEPHPLLRGRIPRELAIESDAGARRVEHLLGSLKHGTAV